MLLTREMFNELISVFRPRFIQCVEKALEDAKADAVDITDISEVIMVGGSTRTPYVQEEIRRYFEEAGAQVRINADIDPDTVVAYGATLLAKRISGQANEDEDLILNDITPLPLGLLQSTQIPQGFLASIFMKAEYEEKML